MGTSTDDPTDKTDGPRADPEWADPPWSIQFFGLPEAEARFIVKLAEEHGVPYRGYVPDPRQILTLTIDRVAAEWLRAALSEVDSVVHALSWDSEELETVSPAKAREEMDGIVAHIDDFLALEVDEASDRPE